MQKAFRIVILMGLLLTSVSCGFLPKGETDGETMLQIVYARVHDGTISAWTGTAMTAPFLWGVFWFILAGGLAVICAAALAGRNATVFGCIGAIFAGILFGGIAFWSVGSSFAQKVPEFAEKQGIHAMKEGYDGAKNLKANQFIETVHVPVVSADIIYEDCQTRINSRSNCKYQWSHEVNPHDCRCRCVSENKDGSCSRTQCDTCWDTEYVPYFTRQCQYRINVRYRDDLATPETGLTPDPREKNIPYRMLSDRWLVPADYDNFWKGSRRTAVDSSDTAIPQDWQRYSAVLKSGKVPLVTAPHRYMNWIFTSDAAMFRQFEGDIELYEKAGLLPTMNWVYSRLGQGWAADYDFVQFVGGITVDRNANYAWQDAAYAFSSFFGNSHQGSLTIVFAPKSAVEALGSADKWADTIKANYSKRGKWDITVNGEKLQRLLPKNSFLIACVVEGDKIPSDGCRIRTGMPNGNEQVINDFAYPGMRPEFKMIPFTPEGFFGKIQATLAPKDKSAFLDVVLKTDGNKPMDLALRDKPDGLWRVSMSDFQYLKADVQLDKGEIDALVTREIQIQKNLAHEDLKHAWIFLLSLAAIVGFFVGGAVLQKSAY